MGEDDDLVAAALERCGDVLRDEVHLRHRRRVPHPRVVGELDFTLGEGLGRVFERRGLEDGREALTFTRDLVLPPVAGETNDVPTFRRQVLEDFTLEPSHHTRRPELLLELVEVRGAVEHPDLLGLRNPLLVGPRVPLGEAKEACAPAGFDGHVGLLAVLVLPHRCTRRVPGLGGDELQDGEELDGLVRDGGAREAEDERGTLLQLQDGHGTLRLGVLRVVHLVDDEQIPVSVGKEREELVEDVEVDDRHVEEVREVLVELADGHRTCGPHLPLTLPVDTYRRRAHDEDRAHHGARVDVAHGLGTLAEALLIGDEAPLVAADRVLNPGHLVGEERHALGARDLDAVRLGGARLALGDRGHERSTGLGALHVRHELVAARPLDAVAGQDLLAAGFARRGVLGGDDHGFCGCRVHVQQSEWKSSRTSQSTAWPSRFAPHAGQFEGYS